MNESTICDFCYESGELEAVPPHFDDVELICINQDCYVNKPLETGR